MSDMIENAKNKYRNVLDELAEAALVTGEYICLTNPAGDTSTLYFPTEESAKEYLQEMYGDGETWIDDAAANLRYPSGWVSSYVFG